MGKVHTHVHEHTHTQTHTLFHTHARTHTQTPTEKVQSQLAAPRVSLNRAHLVTFSSRLHPLYLWQMDGVVLLYLLFLFLSSTPPPPHLPSPLLLSLVTELPP